MTTVVSMYRWFSHREVLKEDESGSLKSSVEAILYQSKRKRFVCVNMLNMLEKIILLMHCCVAELMLLLILVL